MTRPAPQSGRRRMLATMLAVAAGPAMAFDLGQQANLWTMLSSHVTPAGYELRARRYAQAAQRLAQANALIEADAGTGWPFRCYVLPRYAFALLQLGRAPEAAAMLRQAIAAHDAIVASGLAPFTDVLAKLDAALGQELGRVEYAREVMAAIRTEEVIGTVDGMARNTDALTDLWMLVPRVFGAAGEREALERFYTERFAMLPVDPTDPPRLAAREYRLNAFAHALHRAGFVEAPFDAWRRTRVANAQRIDATMRAASPHSVFAACTLRRMYLSSAILAAHGNGQLHRQRLGFVADILATKSAGVRYAGAMRLALQQQAPDSAAELARLEDAIAALPAVMADPRPFLGLVAEHDLAGGRAARRLGLQATGFAVPDEGMVASLQARLDGAAAIGFLVVDGTALRGDEPGPARHYVRYCVTRDDIQLRVLAGQGEVDRLVRACRAEYLGGAAVSRAGAGLARVLFDGLPASADAAREWLIEPDGVLHLAPFDALPAPDGKLFLQTHLLRVVTSLARLPEKHTALAGADALILADPACDEVAQAPVTDTSLRWSSDNVRLRPLPALADARQEASAVAATLARLGLRSRILQGAEATVTSLQQARQPAVLHIAGHAVLREMLDGTPEGVAQQENALDFLLPGRQAALVLSRDGHPDVFLAKDLARLALRGTSLVVLSTCDSANGDLLPGEGVASLRSAVELAGARSTVAAIWAVPSAATGALMRDFYEGLARGARIGDALREAKLAAHARGSVPRAWAGFQLSGADGILRRPA